MKDCPSATSRAPNPAYPAKVISEATAWGERTTSISPGSTSAGSLPRSAASTASAATAAASTWSAKDLDALAAAAPPTVSASAPGVTHVTSRLALEVAPCTRLPALFTRLRDATLVRASPEASARRPPPAAAPRDPGRLLARGVILCGARGCGPGNRVVTRACALERHSLRIPRRHPGEGLRAPQSPEDTPLVQSPRGGPGLTETSASIPVARTDRDDVLLTVGRLRGSLMGESHEALLDAIDRDLGLVGVARGEHHVRDLERVILFQ